MRIHLAGILALIVTASACDSEVPIGSGDPDGGGSGGTSGADGGTGAQAGSAGTGGTGGTDASGGVGGEGGIGGTGGEGGIGGTGGEGGIGGTGGEGGTSGVGGTGGAGGTGGVGGTGGAGGSNQCPVTAATQHEVLAEGWPMPRGVAIDNSNVYFVNWNFGGGVEPSVVTVPKAGGSSTILGTATMYPASKSAFAGPDLVVLAGDTLYLRAASGNEVWKMPKAGGQPVAVFTSNTDPMMLNGPPSATAYGMGVDATNIYFPRTFWTDPGDAYRSGVYRVPVGGGSPAVIAEYQNTVNAPVGIAGTVLLDGSALTWVRWDDSAPGSAGEIHTAETNGSNVADLTQSGMVQGIAFDASDLYFAQDAFLMRIAKTGGTITLVAQLPGTFPYIYGIALDSAYIYATFKDYGAPQSCGGVVRIAKSDGAIVTLATGNRPIDIAVDAESAYYSDLEAGTVNRVALP